MKSQSVMRPPGWWWEAIWEHMANGDGGNRGRLGFQRISTMSKRHGSHCTCPKWMWLMSAWIEQKDTWCGLEFLRIVRLDELMFKRLAGACGFEIGVQQVLPVVQRSKSSELACALPALRIWSISMALRGNAVTTMNDRLPWISRGQIRDIELAPIWWRCRRSDTSLNWNLEFADVDARDLHSQLLPASLHSKCCSVNSCLLVGCQAIRWVIGSRFDH